MSELDEIMNHDDGSKERADAQEAELNRRLDEKEKDRYGLQENIAAISADVHADNRLPKFIERTESYFPDRLLWIIQAAKCLSHNEPQDYEDSALGGWYETTEAIADGLYADLSPETVVLKALGNPDVFFDAEGNKVQP